MRLGEIRNIIWDVLLEDNRISIEHEAIYGGQAYVIKNYGLLVCALDVLAKQNWNQANYDEIESIKKEYGVNVKQVELPQEKFNQLNSYVSALNEKLPFYVSILETMVEDQDKKTINIKLSESIKNFSELSNANKRFSDILKLFNVDGQFDFKGFDRGSEWYIVVPVGVLSYRFFIAGLDIAKKYFETRKAYFESEKAKLDLQAALDKADISKTDLDNYQKRRMNVLIKDEVGKAIERIGHKGNDKNELNTKIIKATTKLIKELDEEGTEFHLSLNPPEYANEYMGKIVIDYSKMTTLNGKQDNKQRQISPNSKQDK